MTVKINNKKLFNMCTEALENGDYNKNNSWSVHMFWKFYTNEESSFINDPNNYRMAIKIADAIAKGKEIELEERRFALRAKNVKDQDGDSIYLQPQYGRLSVGYELFFHSGSEWKKYFDDAPYMHREDFEEVEECQ